MPRPDNGAEPTVLIVDDSSSVRAALGKALKLRGLNVIGGAADSYMARDLIFKLKPDVITLDLQMPNMDGLTFLGRLMAYLPMPVVVLSALTDTHRELAFQAMSLGAVEVFPKPSGATNEQDFDRLALALRRAASARPRRQAPAPAAPEPPFASLDLDRIIAIGASTGGTSAIHSLLESLPACMPPILIVQHMPPGFTETFARRLDRIGKLRVIEAQDGDLLSPGLVLLAPGGLQMRVERWQGKLRVRVAEGPLVHHVAPSVDVLFHSMAGTVGKKGVGILLTGMGRDGAEGMLAMRRQGALTLAQDEASSVIFGMPREAIKIGAAEKTLALSEMGPTLLGLLRPNESFMEAL